MKRALTQLRANSSPGPDDLHPLLLKKLADTLCAPLAEIFQRSLDTGTVPLEWKRGLIKPLFKGGDHADPANYRPITLTSVAVKTMERLIKNHLEDFLERADRNTPEQHSFMRHRSCLSNLITAREHWCGLVDNGDPVDVVFVDFSKAFDRVPHGRLIEKLKSVGISGSILRWITNFVTCRVSQVDVNGSRSTPFCPSSGVPQGSVLGPFLFKVYVSDLLATLE